MNNARGWMKVVRAVFLICLPLLGLAIIAGVTLYWGFGVAMLGDNFIVLADRQPLPERRFWGLSAVLVPTGLMLAALWRLFEMFRETDVQRIRLSAIHHLRAFAGLSIGTVASAFLLSGVMRWAMGVFDDAPLWTHLGFSVSHAATVFGAAVVYFATYLIEEGYAYKLETEEYV
ncbi:MAG: hypothetical protein AAFY34_10175 [Pseudomonadota bacterium]